MGFPVCQEVPEFSLLGRVVLARPVVARADSTLVLRGWLWDR